MKKIIFAVLTFCLFSGFAELYPSRRYVELGFGAFAQGSQNAMPLKDIFKKKLVLDMSKISSNMSKSGFTTSVYANPEFHLAFNFASFGFGFYAQTEISARLNIEKELFDALADGVKPGKNYSSEGNIWAESFVSFAVPVRFNVGKFRIRVAPAVFAPVFYVPATTITSKAVNGNDGSVTISASAPIEIYTVGKFKGLVKDGKLSTDFVNNLDSSELSRDLAQSMGFDLSALVECPISDTLDLGGYANIPILPSRLKHKVSASAKLSVQTDSLLKVIMDDSKIEKEAEFSDAVYSDENYLVNRPLRLGVDCAWRPVGKWLTMRASGGMAMRNPFGKDFSIKSVYPEYRLGLELVGIGMFGLNLSTEYRKKVFAHTVGIMLNFRAVEFDICAAVSSATFIQSFKGEGLAAGASVKFGW